MDWVALAPAVFSLVGVALGTVGSLTVGYITNRTTRAQARIQHVTALRSERKEVILEYLREMQKFHDFVVRIWEGDPDLPQGREFRSESARLDSEMWFYQKKLLLVASEPLRKASLAFTERLNSALYERRPEGVAIWDFIDPAQDKFLEAARVDLGVRSDYDLPRRIRSSESTN